MTIHRRSGAEQILFVPPGSEPALRRFKARAYARFYLRPCLLFRNVALIKTGGLRRLIRALFYG